MNDNAIWFERLLAGILVNEEQEKLKVKKKDLALVWTILQVLFVAIIPQALLWSLLAPDTFWQRFFTTGVAFVIIGIQFSVVILLISMYGVKYKGWK